MLSPREWVLFLVLCQVGAQLAWNVAAFLNVLVHWTLLGNPYGWTW